MSLPGASTCLGPALTATKYASKSVFCAQCFENELWDRCSVKRPWARGGGSACALIIHFVTSLFSVEKIKITEIVFDIELRCIRHTLYNPNLWLYSFTQL